MRTIVNKSEIRCAVSLFLRSLSVDIGGRRVVDEVSLSIAPGESVALIGASGSGKSLTASVLTGALPPRARITGHLEIQGRSVAPTSRHRPDVAAVRQDSLTALHPLVRIDRQFVPVLIRSGAATTRSAAAALAAHMLQDVGFTDPVRVLQSYPMELSGGQRQRVCILRALACRAAFIVADEPTTALDTVSQHRVLSALQKAAHAGAGILLITHDIAVAASLCSRAVILARGVIVDEGSFAHLASDRAHPEARALMQCTQHDAGHGEGAGLGNEVRHGNIVAA